MIRDLPLTLVKSIAVERPNGAYCQVKVSYCYRNGKGGKVVHNAETSKARLGLWSFLTKWDSFGDKTAILWIVSWTTLSKHLQASNGYVQSLTCSNGYNGLSTAMDFTSVNTFTLIGQIEANCLILVGYNSAVIKDTLGYCMLMEKYWDK